MPKEKTVNLRRKNAILCFGAVSVNNLAVPVMAFSLPTAREILGDEKGGKTITLHTVNNKYYNCIEVFSLRYARQLSSIILICKLINFSTKGATKY